MNNKKILISVIVPVYNAERTLIKCVNSIEAQTIKELQIILIDDCSSDNSLNICLSLQKADSRIEVFHQKENKGPGAARNIGLSHVLGEYIFFADADDLLDKTCLELLFSILNNNDICDMAICGHYVNGVIQKNKFSQIQYFSKIETAYAIAGNNNSHFKGYLWNKLFRTKIIKKANLLFDENLYVCEDSLFCQEYNILSNGTIYTPKPLYNYICTKTSITHEKINEKHLSVLEGYNKIIACCNIYNDPNLTSLLIANKWTHHIILFTKILKTSGQEKIKYGDVIYHKLAKNLDNILFCKNLPIKRKIICLLSMICYTVEKKLIKSI